MIDWFAFFFWLLLWFYFVDCHSLCIVRSFSRVWLSFVCFAMVLSEVWCICGIKSWFIEDLFNGFDVGVCGVAFW